MPNLLRVADRSRARAFYWACLLQIAILPATPASGQDTAAVTAACERALIQSVEFDTLDSSYQLAFFRTITRENFDQRKQQAGGSLKWGGVELGGDYDSFSQNFEKLRDQQGYRESSEVANARIRKFVPTEGYRVFDSCMRNALSRPDAYGAHAWVAEEDDKVVTVRLLWRPTATEPGKVTDQALVGGSVEGRAAGQWLAADTSFGPNQGAVVFVKRTGRDAIRGTASINGIPVSFSSAPVDPPPSYSVAVLISATAAMRQTGSYQTTVNVTHNTCADVSYSRVDTLCLPEGHRAASVTSAITQPVPGMPLPPNGCFQVTNPTLSAAATPNCTTLTMTYKECISLMIQGTGPSLPNPQLWPACVRGRQGGGTPVAVNIATEHTKPEHIEHTERFRGVSISSRRIAFPDSKKPQGAATVEYTYAVTVTDLVSGAAFQLSKTTPDLPDSPFRLVFPAEPGVVEVVQKAPAG